MKINFILLFTLLASGCANVNGVKVGGNNLNIPCKDKIKYGRKEWLSCAYKDNSIARLVPSVEVLPKDLALPNIYINQSDKESAAIWFQPGGDFIKITSNAEANNYINNIDDELNRKINNKKYDNSIIQKKIEEERIMKIIAEESSKTGGIFVTGFTKGCLYELKADPWTTPISDYKYMGCKIYNNKEVKISGVINNVNQYLAKDPRFSCSTYSKSGTFLSQDNTHIYEILKPGEMKKIIFQIAVINADDVHMVKCTANWIKVP